MSGGAPVTQNMGYNPEDARAQSFGTQGYNASQVGYNPNAQMQGSMGNLNTVGGQAAGAFNQFGDMSSMALNQAQGLMSGQSPLLQAQRQQMMQGLGDVGAQQSQGQNRMLAQRGLGGGGLRGALGSGQASAMGEQARKGLLGIAGQGMQSGMGMFGQAVGALGQGVGALGQAGQMYGQSGQLASQQDARGLQAGLANQAATNQASQFGANWANQANMQNANAMNQANMYNAQAQNQATEFGKTGNYNQRMANQAARNDFNANMAGSFMSMLPFSDRRLKDNITTIGKSSNGTNIYQWNYKEHPNEVYEGVMADEVPYASIKMLNGYYAVDYSKTDVNFRRVE